MNHEIKNKWAEALKSGRYKQGRYQLRNSDDEYCCLGVLCEIAVKQGIISNAIYESRKNCYGYGEDVKVGSLPQELMEWSGLEDCFGDSVVIDGKLWNLSIHNDRGATFEDIAKAIEEQL